MTRLLKIIFDVVLCIVIAILLLIFPACASIYVYQENFMEISRDQYQRIPKFIGKNDGHLLKEAFTDGYISEFEFRHLLSAAEDKRRDEVKKILRDF